MEPNPRFPPPPLPRHLVVQPAGHLTLAAGLTGAVDDVRVYGTWVDCLDYTPPAVLPPNPIGETLLVGIDPAGHIVLSWQAPSVDGSHDSATVYRVERASARTGPFVEVGSATVTQWVDVDALASPESYYYRVFAENARGSEGPPQLD